VYLGSHTSILFGNNVFIRKVDEKGVFTHVLLNKGALTKQYDEHISIEGLNIIVNGIDKPFSDVYGLRGQLAFFYIKEKLKDSDVPILPKCSLPFMFARLKIC
jgi:hypothetical protein